MTRGPRGLAAVLLGLAAWAVAPMACGAPVAAAPGASEPAPDVDDTAVQGGLVPRLDASKIGPAVRRCGWWDNPTPGNAWLTDRDGEWTVAMQGMYEAAGRWPDFKPGQQAPRGAPHGHGCTCAMVRADPQTKFVYSVADAKALPLKTCRADPTLKGKEPEPR